jgi:Mrp family chromosome partitioning ATPase
VAEVLRSLAPALQAVPQVSELEAPTHNPRTQDCERLMHKLRRPSRPNPQNTEATNAGARVPAALTPLLGREAALQATQQLLQSTRCLTLTGAGGSGKTRLALALAEAACVQNPSVWWVELDKLSDPKMLAATVAQSVGLSDPHKRAVRAVVERFQGLKVLLVLDNCEHLLDACAELATQLLRELPLLQLLTTSRERVGRESKHGS